MNSLLRPPDTGLAGRAVVVVGGGSGIGAAVAGQAAALGAAVTVADTDAAAGEKVAAETGGGYSACDATRADQVEEVLAGVLAERGRLDAVVTTVGGAHLAAVEDVGAEDWTREITFNLTSAYVVGRAALALLRRQGGGALVTFTSGYAWMPAPDRAGYAAAKAGVVSLTRTLATAGAPDGVRVNCVAPGPTDTPRFRAMNGGDEGVERVRQSMPLGRIPRPEDVAAVAVFLVSDAARAVTGQVVHVNGGVLMP